jgi:acetyl esterase
MHNSIMKYSMRLTNCISLSIAFWIISTSAIAQKNDPPQIDCSKIVTYKHVENVELKLWMFNPPNHQSSDKSPAIVFFFGGGWNTGNPEQFVPHCQYLASRGMVAAVADYRVFSRHKVMVPACVSDAKSAVRWMREHAQELGIDPNRIAAGGGSAGGHLAASTAFLPKFDEPGENQKISSKPNALVLFNPALILASPERNDTILYEVNSKNSQRFGPDPEDVSPFHHVNKNAPPTIIFHGTKDTTVPFESVRLFSEKMKESGNKCTVIAYKGQNHGFFNFGRDNNGPFIDTVNKIDSFLVSAGYLKAPPESLTQ